MSKRILRVTDIYGPGGRIPVKKSKFYEDFVYHPGGEENIPKTDIPRLRLIGLGSRAKGGLEEHVDAIVDGLAALAAQDLKPGGKAWKRPVART